MIGDGSERAEQGRLERRRLAMSPKAQPAQSKNLLSKVATVAEAGRDAESDFAESDQDREPDVPAIGP